MYVCMYDDDDNDDDSVNNMVMVMMMVMMIVLTLCLPVSLNRLVSLIALDKTTDAKEQY